MNILFNIGESVSCFIYSLRVTGATFNGALIWKAILFNFTEISLVFFLNFLKQYQYQYQYHYSYLRSPWPESQTEELYLAEFDI